MGPERSPQRKRPPGKQHSTLSPGPPASEGLSPTAPRKTPARKTKAELIRHLQGLETDTPGSVSNFHPEHERLLHERQVHELELKAQDAELIEAQRLLERSRDRYADFYDFAPFGYVALDDQGGIRELNLTAAKMLGAERTRLIGVPFRRYVVAEDQARFRAHLSELAVSEERIVTELSLAGTSGRTIRLLIQSARAFDPEKKGYLSRTTLTDITARHTAELKLHENEARLRAVLDTAIDGIITIDEHGVIESFNPAAEKLFGYSASAAIGQNISLLMPSPHREQHDQYLANYRDTGERKVIGIGREVSGRRQDGSLFPLGLSVGEVKLAGRRIFTGFVHDLTRRKHAEESMREELDFIAAVLQTAGALVIVLDEVGRVVRFNRACEQLTSYTAPEIIGKVIWNLLLPPEEVAAVQAVFAKLRAGQLPSQFENCWLTKAGQTRLISWTNTVLTHPDGTVKHIIGTGVDITDRRREEQLRHLQYEIARLLAAADSLTKTVPKLLRIVAETFNWDVGELWEKSGQPERLRVVNVWHAPGDTLATFVKLSLELSFSLFDGLPGRVLSSGEPEWIPEISQCARFDRREAAVKAGLRSALAFPIQAQHRTLGVMAFLTHHATEPSKDLLQLFTSLGHQIGQFMERRRAEVALREANEFGEQIIGGAQAGIIVCDRQRRLVVWNPFMEQITGYRSEEVLNRPGVEGISFLRELHFERFLDRALAGEGFEAADIHFDVPKTGKQGWVTARFAPWRGVRKDIIGVIVAVRDITDRRRLEVELIESSDREQQRIGHDLHDGLGQQLTALEMRCYLLQEDLAAADSGTRSTQLQEQARQMGQGLRECIAATRSLAHGLALANLTTDGLIGALEQLARRACVPGQIECQWNCTGPVSFENVRTAGQLYRIAQEAVNNAIKHGRKRHLSLNLSLTLKHDSGTLRLQIKDDGRGFPARRNSRPGMGLEVMRHRAQVIGGTLEIDSKPGRGVTITCSLPWHPPDR